MSSKKTNKKNNTVRVAVRIRPQNPQEIEQKMPICTSVTPGEPQVTIGREKFIFDIVFDQMTSQKAIYQKCAKELVEGTFEGYNATVFAYGQTGTGKTYTMGTSVHADQAYSGIIPSAAQQIFDEIEQRREHARRIGEELPTFEVNAQFIELYNDEIVDLLSSGRNFTTIKIKEDTVRHDISLQGVSSRNVASQPDILSALAAGAQNRTTAAANKQSSSSHLIFTVYIKQTHVLSAENIANGENLAMGTELETLNAKFHFVDLAGTGHLSRTGTTGGRANERTKCGLLTLGKVIRALSSAKGQVGHVPYRDSKLTRLLQDSLGGNSRTVMITCVSPNEADFVETRNCLKFALLAKSINNELFANQNKPSAVITELRIKVQTLEAELRECKEKLVAGEQQQKQQEENIQKLEKKVSDQSELIERMEEANQRMEETNQQMRTVAIEWASATEQIEERGRTMSEGRKRRPLAAINGQRSPWRRKPQRLNTTYNVGTPTVDQQNVGTSNE